MTKQRLILIPGLMNDASLWTDQIHALHDIAACDVADITQQDSLEAMAQAVLAMAGERFSLAGFSLGGYVAQEIMRIAPERVARLALLDTGIKPDTPERELERRMLDKAAQAPGRFHGFGERLLDAYLSSVNRYDEAVIERIRSMTQRLGPDVFLRQNNVRRKDGEDVLRTLNCPVLILCGAHDRITPPDDHRRMAALVPHAELVIVENAGHMAPLESPHEVTEALRRWLGKDAV